MPTPGITEHARNTESCERNIIFLPYNFLELGLENAPQSLLPRGWRSIQARATTAAETGTSAKAKAATGRAADDAVSKVFLRC